jgi:hypothetical protein
MKIGDLPAAQQLDIDSVPGLLGKLNKYDRDGKRFNTDADIYNALVTTSPKDLAKISDSEFNNKFRSLLSNADYADILARRAVGLGADTKGGVNIVSTQDQITYSLKDAGILEEKGAKNIKQQEQAYSLTLQIQKQIKAEEVSIGAKNGLTENKIQGIIDRVILDDKKNKIERPGRFFGSSEVTLSSLSKQQQQVINQMNAMGIPLTRENQEKAMLQAGIK